MIDDRLPTRNGSLVYLHSSKVNEFWSALFEKAYAKLYGSYEALDGGSSSDALVDFTGGVTEEFDLKKPPANLFVMLTKAFERDSMMGCSINSSGTTEGQAAQGLISGHAYSVTKSALAELASNEKQPLMRLRNPWGDAEWEGAFSDKSKEWKEIPDEAKTALGLKFDDDGEFWMSFRDFLSNFDSIEVCNLSPDETLEVAGGKKKKWNVKFYEGKWVVGVSAGGCSNYPESFYRNPQYVMTIEDVDEGDEDGLATVLVGLMQKNSRLKRNTGSRGFAHIGFSIYSVTKEDFATRPQNRKFFENRKSVAKSEFSYVREQSVRLQLKPGRYLIVPSTFDPNVEGEFILRIFSEGRSTLEENDKPVEIADDDGSVSWKSFIIISIVINNFFDVERLCPNQLMTAPSPMIKCSSTSSGLFKRSDGCS